MQHRYSNEHMHTRIHTEETNIDINTNTNTDTYTDSKPNLYEMQSISCENYTHYLTNVARASVLPSSISTRSHKLIHEHVPAEKHCILWNQLRKGKSWARGQRDVIVFTQRFSQTFRGIYFNGSADD